MFDCHKIQCVSVTYQRDEDLESCNCEKYNKPEFFRVSSRDHMHVVKTYTRVRVSYTCTLGRMIPT